MVNKINNSRSIVISLVLFLFIFFILPLTSAELSAEEVFDNIDVKLTGISSNLIWSTTKPEANNTFVRVKVSNFNKNIPVTIENISILNSKNELILFEEFNFTSQPVGKEKERSDRIIEMRNKIGPYNPLIIPFVIFYMPLNKLAMLKIKEHEFSKKFSDLNIYDFNPVMNEYIYIHFQITLKYKDEIEIRNLTHSILMKQAMARYH